MIDSNYFVTDAQIDAVWGGTMHPSDRDNARRVAEFAIAAYIDDRQQRGPKLISLTHIRNPISNDLLFSEAVWDDGRVFQRTAGSTLWALVQTVPYEATL